MAKVKITQIKSKIGSSKRQKACLESLGLRRINHSVEREGTPETLGMIEKVKHLVRVEQ
ncbi:MAG: 50S ribosomal protein L30 [Tenuifilaceae bacterium]|jgi:large subunit ribosomal protein L30|uniref:50S ribosomal protein L30 n=1 Tax=Perlabentimonas gracilis TaxID=2715279 RepID=UPI00140B5D4E|nr:50S ribosomal protein L30 [Perlabentimonas gracilis]MDX9769179.1 50S ribosomal protein L30 [Tenuifilaceae bacterium]MDY0252907.1 50S ribosomal protein L30 [Tenuifilaceae bacterium]NHB68318.1 50S ribosomal protein L30 [Perlabentimonas gracilis]